MTNREQVNGAEIRQQLESDDPRTFFDGLVGFARAIGAAMVLAHKRKKQQRLARRRELYAIRKTLPKKPKPVSKPVVYFDTFHEGCQCTATNHPPCSWCENGGTDQ